jgi:hypothetical protein
MTIYVDDAHLPATVGRHTSSWCHLTADTQQELHEFAARLGLKRSYFQPGKPIGGKPSPFWHYDVTAGMRVKSIGIGAQPTPWREMPDIMRAREAARQRHEEHPDPSWPRLLFTSSRDGVTEADVEAALRPMFAPGKVLVAGGARGGDQIAARLWREWGGQVDERKVSPEAWQRSRGAGYARNAEMVQEVKAKGGECLAVIARCTSPKCDRAEPHGTHGAVHCAGAAEAAGLPVTRVKAATQVGGDIEAAIQSLSAAGILAPERTATRVAGARTAPAGPAADECNASDCGQPGRLYMAGIRCDDHKPPVTFWPATEATVAERGGPCPCCGKARLTLGRMICQGCGVVAATQPPPEREFPDLSHGQPGHMCVLPEREAEAGS